MDILYIVGNGSKWDNNELRFSLRSISMYGQNVGRIFICGNKPDWVSDEVTYIPCGDVTRNCAHKNILYKTMYAISHSDIDKHFLISSDDHFYMRQVDFDNYPLYYRFKDIPRNIEPEHIKNPYFHSLIYTRQLLKLHGLTIYQTNPHCNTHFDVEVFKRNKILFDKAMKILYGGEMNCIMGNLLVKKGWEAVPFDDKKIKSFESREDLLKQIGNVECISMYDTALGCGIGDYLQERFPEKCIYEK